MDAGAIITRSRRRPQRPHALNIGGRRFAFSKASGGFSAAEFTPRALFGGGLLGGWYDPSDISTMFQNSNGTTAVAADGDPVGYIADRSGAGNHLIQATAGARPLYKTSGGLSWLEFDGIDDQLVRADTAAFRNASMGVATVWRPGRDTRDDHISSGNSSAFATNNWIVSNTTTLDVYGRTPASVLTSGVVASGSDYVSAVWADGATIFRQLNGGAVASDAGAFGTDDTTGFAVGGTLSGAPTYFLGRFYGGVVRNAAWTTAERTNLNTYLGRYAGLVL